MKPRIVFHVFAVLVLIAAVAAAQSPKEKKATAAGRSADRESSAPSVSEVEMHSGMVTGKRQHQEVTAPSQPTGGSKDRESSSPSVSELTAHAPASSVSKDRESSQPSMSEAGVSLNARNSAHASEAVSGKMLNAQSADSGRTGVNPLYEAKDKTAAPPSGNANGSKPVIEYKDGEDGTTHTRPGNHKPSN